MTARLAFEAIEGDLTVELADGIDARAVFADLLDAGLITNAVDGSTLRLVPPLTVSSDEIAEAVAQTQEIANAVVGLARVTLLHSDFPGRLCKEGNMAFPFSPSDIERGAIYQFSMRHVVEPDDPLEMFPIEYQDI